MADVAAPKRGTVTMLAACSACRGEIIRSPRGSANWVHRTSAAPECDALPTLGHGETDPSAQEYIAQQHLRDEGWRELGPAILHGPADADVDGWAAFLVDHCGWVLEPTDDGLQLRWLPPWERP